MSGHGSVTATNTFGPSGLISRHTSSGSVFYAFDYRNSAAQRLNGSGTVLSSQTFDAYGTRLSTDGNTDPYAGFGGQAGYYTDWETGTASSALELLTFRYYDPAAGRFLNRDPIGHSGGANVYEYVNNGPTGATDSSGLLPGSPVDALIESIGAAVGACVGAFLGNMFAQNNDPCNNKFNICMQWGECIADAFSAGLGAFAAAYAPQLVVAIGCLEGALSAALHVAAEKLCEYLFPPCRPDASPDCQLTSIVLDVAFGCLDGVISGGMSEIEDALNGLKQAAEGAFEALFAMFNNGLEAGNCKDPYGNT